jgi:hypothetical protein
MEYVIGSIVTLFIIYFVNRFIKREIDTQGIASISYSQSHIHNLINPFLPDNSELIMLRPTQATKHMEETQLRVIIVEDKAYWIKDNDFFVADLINGSVDRESARLVDTMSMSKVELEKIIFIVEKLTGETR